MFLALEMLKNTNLTQGSPAATLYHSFIEAIRRSYPSFIQLGMFVLWESDLNISVYVFFSFFVVQNCVFVL